ncbi:Heat shock protein [Schistosoma japonicum]|nr:Heat shock protein [Schistosoma japonicum]
MAVSVVGFDIGTLTSYIGVARGGGIEVITNEYSERATPTCVAFSGELVLVGTAAKLQQVMNTRNTFTDFTRLLGKRLSDLTVVDGRKFTTHQVEESSDGRITLSAVLNGEKTSFVPEQILAIQMNKLKEVAEATIGSKVVDVVVNVPTYYTDTERRAVLDATKVAGLNCVKVVNDITAIGTAYGFYKTDLPQPELPPKVVAFVSVGYSTTQVGICSFNIGKLKVLATTCDAFLGGRDFDGRLLEKFAVEFQQQHKLKAPLPTKAIIRLLQECEKLKKAMSANSSELPINVECLTEDRDLTSKMKRADFEELCLDLVDRFRALLTKCLDTAKLKSEDIHSIELIGGSSRIPMLKDAVVSIFKQEGITTLNADEAVARGCAFQAAICSPAFKVRDFNVVEACLYPIEIKFDREEGSEQCMQTEEIGGAITTQGKAMHIEVFPFLHPIPSSRQIFLTRRGALTLEARYANKEGLPNGNVVIGTFRIGEASQMFTEPRKIRLKLRMNTHGIFNISQAQLVEEYEKEVEVSVSEDNPVVDGPANSTKEMTTAANEGNENPNPSADNGQVNTQDSTSPKKKTVLRKKKFTKYHDLSIEVNNMQFSTKQLNEFCEICANLIFKDKLERERVNAKNAVEEYVYEMRSKLQGSLNPFASPTESESLLQLLDATEEWLYGDGECSKRQVYVEKLAELKNKGDPIVHRANEHLNRPLAVENFNRSLVVSYQY